MPFSLGFTGGIFWQSWTRGWDAWWQGSSISRHLNGCHLSPYHWMASPLSWLISWGSSSLWEKYNVVISSIASLNWIGNRVVHPVNELYGVNSIGKPVSLHQPISHLIPKVSASGQLVNLSVSESPLYPCLIGSLYTFLVSFLNCII